MKLKNRQIKFRGLYKGVEWVYGDLVRTSEGTFILVADPKFKVIWLEVDPNTVGQDRKSTRLNSSHSQQSRMPSSA